MNRNQAQGFTLVELAIALMVIGLLIGGVLKGQELIENAKVTATLRDLSSYDAAVMIFRNTYNAVPGDMKKPNRIPNCTTEICNSPGNGNGRVASNTNDGGGNSTIAMTEWFNFFTHMTKAGMIKGPEGGTDAEMSNVQDEEWFDLSVTKEKFFPMTATGMVSIDDYGSQQPAWFLRTIGKYYLALAYKLGRDPSLSSNLVEDCPAADYAVDPENSPDSALDDNCGMFIELN